MATIDQVAGTEEVSVAPQPAAPPPPPPGAQPVATADGTRRTTRRTVKRRPVPRGTAAVSGGAVVGTLLTVVYAAAGPVALVATAAGAVAIPFAIWRRNANSRTNRRATARRSARRRENGRGSNATGSGSGSNRSGSGSGLGNPLAGLGGGGGGSGAGSRSAGRSLFGAGAGGGRKGKAGKSGNPWADLGLGGGKAGKSAGATKSGRVPKSKRGGDGSRTVGGRGGRSRQVTPKVGRRARPAGGAGGGAPKNPRGGGAGGWKPPKGAAPKNQGGSKVSSPKVTTRGGSGGGWKPPKATASKPATPKPAVNTAKPASTPPAGNAAPTVKKVKRNRTPGYGPQGRGGKYGPWKPPARATGTGRAASAMNHGLWKAGSAFLHGVRKPTGRRAFRSAFRRYGAHGYNPTVTGYVARVAGGVAAAIPAALARLAWMAAKRVVVSVRRAYNPPVPARPAQQQPNQQQPNQQQPVQQAPAPAPAFSRRPIQDFSPRGVPDPIGNPPPARNPHQPATTGGGGSHSHGGNSPMTTVFPAHGNASDFFASACKWSPAANGVDGAIWNLMDALPYMVGSLGLIANGWSNVIANCENGLAGGFHPAMRSEMVQVFNMLQAAAVKSGDLQGTFNKVYADAIARRNIRGGQSLNV